jgi:hypothetical protein
MACGNQTQLYCVNQMGKTQSKPLATRHGRGMAWYVWISLNTVYLLIQTHTTTTTIKVHLQNVWQYLFIHHSNMINTKCQWWINRVAFDGVYLNIMIHAIYPEFAVYVTCQYLSQKIYTWFQTRTIALQNTTTRKMQPLLGTYKLQWNWDISSVSQKTIAYSMLKVN